MTAERDRLPNRRGSVTITIECDGFAYTATASWFADGRLGELFLSNHKSNSAGDANARDAVIAFPFAIQHSEDSEVIRRALCRDSHSCVSGPLGEALDRLLEGGR